VSIVNIILCGRDESNYDIDLLSVACEKRKETYGFTSATGKGEKSTRRVIEGANIYSSRIKEIWGDDILKELYTPIAVLQLGDKHQGMRDNAFEGRLIIVKDFPKID
jgi:hypothetical protein